MTRNILEQALDKVSQHDIEEEITREFRITMYKLSKKAEAKGITITYMIKMK